MRTENEFIAGVHEKYERELAKRNKRVRMISLCATLSACACVAVFVSVRTLPVLTETANDMAVLTAGEQEAAALYDYDGVSDMEAKVYSYSLYTDEEVAEQALDDAAENGAVRSYAEPEAEEQAEVMFKSSATKSKKTDEAAEAGVPEMCAYPTADKVLPYGAVDYSDEVTEVTSIVGEVHSVKALRGSFEWTIPEGADVGAYNVIVNGDVIYQDENVTSTGVVYGEDENGYYVFFEQGTDRIVLELDADTFTLDEVAAIAESLIYVAE